MHSVSRPFICPIIGCGQRFGFKHVLHRHHKNIHIDGKVRVSFYSMSFSWLCWCPLTHTTYPSYFLVSSYLIILWTVIRGFFLLFSLSLAHTHTLSLCLSVLSSPSISYSLSIHLTFTHCLTPSHNFSHTHSLSLSLPPHRRTRESLSLNSIMLELWSTVSLGEKIKKN